jgi:hypothetical protein
VTLNDTCLVDYKLEMPVNDKMKVTFAERADLFKMWKDPKNAKWTWGLAMELKM